MEFVKTLKKQLLKPLPGKHIQYQMAPEDRDIKISETSGSPKKGGVLILLFPKNKTVHFLLMRRADNLKFHGGQISFPGGTFDPNDKSLQQTALRETHEETGLLVPNDAVLGKLTPLYIPISNFHVFPFVAFYPQIPRWKKNNSEVKSLIEVPLVSFLNLKPMVKKDTYGSKTIKIPYFPIDGYHVWGATAMILNEFRTVLKTIKGTSKNWY